MHMLLDSLFHAMDVNARGRDFVVGDVHGHAALLDGLLNAVNFDPAADRLIALGDLVDRGPDSRLLLERLRTQPWFTSVRGNHEAMFKGSRLDWRTRSVWHHCGGNWAGSISEAEWEALAAVVAGMPLSMTLALADGRKIGLVHAELNVNHTWEDLVRVDSLADDDAIDDFEFTLHSSALWGRSRIIAWATAVTPAVLAEATPGRMATIRRALTPIAGLDLVVHGHSALASRKPAAASNLLWIDTGCGYEGGRLTLVEPLTSRYWQSQYRGNQSVGILRRMGSRLPAPSRLPASVTAP